MIALLLALQVTSEEPNICNNYNRIVGGHFLNQCTAEDRQALGLYVRALRERSDRDHTPAGYFEDTAFTADQLHRCSDTIYALGKQYGLQFLPMSRPQCAPKP